MDIKSVLFGAALTAVAGATAVLMADSKITEPIERSYSDVTMEHASWCVLKNPGDAPRRVRAVFEVPSTQENGPVVRGEVEVEGDPTAVALCAEALGPSLVTAFAEQNKLRAGK
jgi:hypothetical protein